MKKQRPGQVDVSSNREDGDEFDMDELFKDLDRRRVSGELTEDLKRQGLPLFRASHTHPNYIDRVHLDGSVEVGDIIDGEFRPLTDL